MVGRYRSLTLYALLLALVAGTWLAVDLAGAGQFPSLWLIVGAIAICLIVWQFGLPAPRVGLISMERMPQVGLLLVFPTPIAAAICASASLIWPLLNRRYSQGSLRVAALRALHNSSMTAIMLMAAGHVYHAAGGRHPLAGLAASDIWPLVLMALTAQSVNAALMGLFIHFDGRDVRRVLTPFYALSDLLFVPAGILAAIIYNASEPATFLLFTGLMLMFVVSFSALGKPSSAAEAASGPLARLSGTTRALRGARRVDDLGAGILSETRALFRFDEFYLVLIDAEFGHMQLRVHERNGERLPVRTKPLAAGLFGYVAQHAKAVLIEDWNAAPDELARQAEITEKRTGSVIIVPLIQDGAVIGLLSVQHTASGIYSEADLNLMRQLAEQVAAAIADARAFEDLEDYRQRLELRVTERTHELERANQDKERLINALRERSRSLERESQEDPLTGIANRRRFDQRLGTEIELARTLGMPLTLAIADMDHFKIVNDRLGHAVGDEVLRQSSALMARLSRANDLVARLGGEEFALILPGMERVAAVEFCERLRRAVERHDWGDVADGLEVTLSIGLSHWDGKADAGELLRAADANLYRAKHAGRNRVA
jgi:diguanylate cyclase (GGDEF)-like protein